MLEKFIINKLVSENSIILKIISLQAISVRSLRMFFSQCWKCSVPFERNQIEKNPGTFFKLVIWDPDLEKKNQTSNI